MAETKKKRWIIDGNYKSTFDIRLPESDVIIYLDYPTHLSMWRAIKRRVYFRKTVRTDMPPTWKERLGWDFAVFIIRFNRSIAPQIRQLVASYPKTEVIVFTSPRQAEAYLAALPL